MNNTESIDWKEFFISGDDGIFTIEATKSGIDKNKLLFDGEDFTPYITRSELSNGINMFVPSQQLPKYALDNGNTITIGLDTQTVFYQPHSFYTGQNIQVLSSDRLNKDIALFICSMLKIQMKKFNWGGNGATLGRLYRTKIMLPINKSGQPDYVFMENYISRLRTIQSSNYVAFIKKHLKELGKAQKLSPLSELDWKPITISRIGSVLKGHDIYDAERVDGNMPYITSGSSNNGIGYFISNQNETIDSNVLSVNRNGAGVGKSYYHKYTALFGGDCRRIKLFDSHYKYAPYFISTEIEKQRKNFSYSRKLGTGRLKKLQIMLPVTSAGKPDYKYMDQYIKNIIIEKYNTYLQFLSK
ncbi:Type I restriction modification DNA specificity domain-containing protein [Butyrivibrio fibrisolvens DSM 3071]|uniref:Type I restriction modification DNA specificity domain-containing protein n=1 Tax=Butyrivibrio fibrisolvens DSM 3071 TaxID=1121131 RepID=A0A1M6FG14_BUTFI|nr:restriction endonuclease subunit S [Butyrivibrio fibrisolvens]SHI96552.1 Type I restriction modification DNA specificity domain-containing protein [Butyrivibrio fibrisolvens DSM 3071]